MLNPFFTRPRANSSDTPPLGLEGYCGVLKRCACSPEKWKLAMYNNNYSVSDDNSWLSLCRLVLISIVLFKCLKGIENMYFLIDINLRVGYWFCRF